MARKDIPPLEEMISYYGQRNLLAHPETVRTMAARVEGSPISIPLKNSKNILPC